MNVIDNKKDVQEYKISEKYKVGQIYQPKIKKTLEKELLFDSVFCQRFLAGEVVLLKIKSEEVIRCLTKL